eukprot:3847145-Pyramimonas_sp.AAC.1
MPPSTAPRAEPQGGDQGSEKGQLAGGDAARGCYLLFTAYEGGGRAPSAGGRTAGWRCPPGARTAAPPPGRRPSGTP